MTDRSSLVKQLSILAFLILLSATYYLRSEVLGLNKIRFSADNLRADEAQKQLEESYPARMIEYQGQVEAFKIQEEHYQKMMELYRNDYSEYVKRIKDQFQPPNPPNKPIKPESPQVRDSLARINADFRQHQFNYFSNTLILNWVACVAALTLVGGLLYLLMFEPRETKVFYLATLVISFVFMIGPSLHTIMSAIIGFLRAPGTY